MRQSLSFSSRRGLLAAAAGLLFAGAGLASAGLASAQAADPPALHYHDGGRRIALSVEPALVADFGPSRMTALSANGTAAPQRVAGDSTVRILRMPAGQDASVAATGPQRSPVFRQGGTPAGRLMALPGGVLVKFKPQWSRTQQNAWLAAQGLPAGQPMALGAEWVRVDTAAGWTALQVANRLQATGEVLSSSPNWWTATASR